MHDLSLIAMGTMDDNDNDNVNDKAAGFVIMSSGRLAMQGRSSCSLVHEQVMMATDKR